MKKMKRLGAVIGMFDGVHLGHRYLFEQLFAECRKRGLEPAVVTFGSHPLETINPDAAPRLLSSPQEKIELLQQVGFQPQNIFMLTFDDKVRAMSAREFMGIMHARYDVDLIVRGFNNRFGTERNLSPEDYRRIGEGEGVEVLDAEGYCHIFDGQELTPSSSAIRRALEEGDITTANQLLGYTYKLSGTVGAGKQLGRTIGFPTANLVADFDRKLIPADGVYVCRANVDGQSYPAMVNIGRRPTVDSPEAPRTIEAHIIGLAPAADASFPDLYGQPLTIEFYSHLRPEIHFASLDDLHRQLEADRQATQKFFEEI